MIGKNSEKIRRKKEVGGPHTSTRAQRPQVVLIRISPCTVGLLCKWWGIPESEFDQFDYLGTSELPQDDASCSNFLGNKGLLFSDMSFPGGT